MAQKRSIVMRVLRFAGRVVWTGATSAGEHDNRLGGRSDDGPARSRIRDVEDPRHRGF